MQNGLNKINQSIQDLVSEVVKIEHYEAKNDFNTRDSHIVANIKVYDWLDQDDLETICKNRNYDARLIEDLKTEFTDDRLNSIYNHVCETEVFHFKEMYESNVDVSDFDKYFAVWSKARQHRAELESEKYDDLKMDYYIETYWKKALRFKTREKWIAHVIKKHESEYEIYQRRKTINFECYTYGRSGGWFSICKTNELENWSFDDYRYSFSHWISYLETIHNNREFNTSLSEDFDVVSHKDKSKFIATLKSFISDFNKLKDNIQFYVDEVENAKRSFKSNLIYELEHEIDVYLEEINIGTNCHISIDNSLMKTSLGVSVKLDDFKNIWNGLKDVVKNITERFEIKRKVGPYFVEYAEPIENDIMIKAGCHRFSFNQMNSVMSPIS